MSWNSWQLASLDAMSWKMHGVQEKCSCAVFKRMMQQV